MTVEYRTIRDAAEAWVREMNAIPQGMIQDLMSLHSYDWMEVTKPSTGDRVYVYEIPDEVDSTTHEGEVKSYNDESELYCIELDDGKLVSAEADDFEVEYDVHSRCGERCGRSATPATIGGLKKMMASGRCPTAASDLQERRLRLLLRNRRSRVRLL